MALNFKRGSRARDGDIWEQSKSLVAVSGWTRLESGCLFQGRAAEMRMPGMRGKSQDCQTAALQRSNDRVGISTAGAVFNIK